MVASVNEKLHDATVGHAIDLQHWSNGVVRRMIALLNRTDPDLMQALQAALDALPASQFSVDRLEGLLSSVRTLNAQAFNTLDQALRRELEQLSEQETSFQAGLFRAAIPEEVQASVPVAQVNPNQVYAAAMSRPFQGRLLKEWMSGLETDRAARVRDAIRIGYVENQTIPQIVQRIRGTRAKGYADGLLDITRRDAESVVRTAISHTAAFARNQFIAANEDIVKAEQWTSTLDSRTSEICRVRDSKRYTPVTHKPIGHSLPWLGGPGAAHWGCRSTATPITKSWQEMGAQADVGEWSASARASMDGQVPAETTYSGWLQKQSAARQDQILGPTRGALMRKGGLTLERFYNDKGKFLSLEDLKSRNEAAFERAGVSA